MCFSPFTYNSILVCKYTILFHSLGDIWRKQYTEIIIKYRATDETQKIRREKVGLNNRWALLKTPFNWTDLTHFIDYLHDFSFAWYVNVKAFTQTPHFICQCFEFPEIVNICTCTYSCVQKHYLCILFVMYFCRSLQSLHTTQQSCLASVSPARHTWQ